MSSVILRHSTNVTKRCMATASPVKKTAPTTAIPKWNESLTKPVEADMIGTPDPISNLRPVKYYIPPNETEEEREWRESCIKVDAFNHGFWHRNNLMFTQAKEEYERNLINKGEEVTAEAMSIFYKDFLDKAYDRQMEYNRAWWKLNTAQLYPGLKAAIRSFKKKRGEVVATGFWEKSFES